MITVSIFTFELDPYKIYFISISFRITFDREGLGTHSIPDYELLSTDPPDVIPLSSFLAKSRHRPPASSSYLSPPYPTTASFSPQLTGDPLMSGSTPRGKSLRLDGVLGGYPVKFLYHIVKLNKSLLVSIYLQFIFLRKP